MSSNLDQQAIDEKIHHFLARKSPIRTFSKTVAERFVPVRLRKRRNGIAYEPTSWGGSQIAQSH